MTSPQNIREKTFTKAMFGGYDMAEVDNFLASVSEELEASQKEVLTLKSKMKVLVEKIEEYRSNEDAMRMALLSAQKISSQIQTEAEQKSAEIMEAALRESDRVLGSIKEQRVLEETQLVEAKRQTAEFIERMRLVCSKQMSFLDAIAESDPSFAEEAPPPAVEAAPNAESAPRAAAAPSPAPPEDDTFRRIEDSVARLTETKDDQSAPRGSVSVGIVEGFDSDDSQKTKPFTPISDIAGTKPRFNFDDLRFGGEKF